MVAVGGTPDDWQARVGGYQARGEPVRALAIAGE
jgi:hypothetical protein